MIKLINWYLISNVSVYFLIIYLKRYVIILESAHNLTKSATKFIRYVCEILKKIALEH